MAAATASVLGEYSGNPTSSSSSLWVGSEKLFLNEVLPQESSVINSQCCLLSLTTDLDFGTAPTILTRVTILPSLNCGGGGAKTSISGLFAATLRNSGGGGTTGGATIPFSPASSTETSPIGGGRLARLTGFLAAVPFVINLRVFCLFMCVLLLILMEF